MHTLANGEIGPVANNRRDRLWREWQNPRPPRELCVEESGAISAATASAHTGFVLRGKRQRRVSYQPGPAAQDQSREEIMRAESPAQRFRLSSSVLIVVWLQPRSAPVPGAETRFYPKPPPNL